MNNIIFTKEQCSYPKNESLKHAKVLSKMNDNYEFLGINYENLNRNTKGDTRHARGKYR